MLEAEAITAGYKNKAVLSALSMRAEPGAVTILVGPNGSGKSTLLRCLAGALRPSSGRVLFAEDDVYRLSAGAAARRIAYVSQETIVPFAFTVKELVSLASGVGGSKEDVAEAIDLLELGHLEACALNSLSGGEQQRAALARGLAQKTPCLLLDEPTAHLDLRHQTSLFKALRKRARDSHSVVVVVLHDLGLAVRYADKIVLLNNGVIQGAGSVEEVITEDSLARIYKVPIRIQRDGSGITAITPVDNLIFP